MDKLLTTPFPKFCPQKSCSYCESTNNKITKNGTYLVKLSGERRQLFYCHKGEHSFSEMAYSGLINKKGSEKEYIQTAKLIKYGLSNDRIADVLEKDSRTIEAWVKVIADKSQNFHDFICLLIGITIEFIQVDELWSYLKNKRRQMWVFISLESQTKFWVNFELGSRTNHTANRLVKNLKALCKWDSGTLLKITTDKLAAYKNALLKQMIPCCARVLIVN